MVFEDFDDRVHVNVASPAGAYTSGNPSFFRYIVRLGELDLPISSQDREALELLASIPHALDGDVVGEATYRSGRGWRVIPGRGLMEWSVLEATPQRLRAALERARRILWANAASCSVSAREIVAIEEELDAVYGVLLQAESAGFAVIVSYTA